MHITLSDIELVLSEIDVEGLLAMGAPRDEYSVEARAIEDLVSRSHAEISEEELVAIISSVWERYFGPFSTEELASRSRNFSRVAGALQTMHSVTAS